jgi:hypothetical protein
LSASITPERKINGRLVALISSLSVMTVTLAVVLRQQGRLWWCKCGGQQLWISEPLSPHTSQHLFDPYSLTHISHGFLFYWLLGFVARKIPVPWRIVMALGIEAAWEVFENTAFVIERYRQTTAALGYQGDSIGNSIGDMLSCGFGFIIAHWLGWKKTLALFVFFEVVLLLTIRDSLLLNILMLIYPSETLIQWQAG